MEYINYRRLAAYRMVQTPIYQKIKLPSFFHNLIKYILTDWRLSIFS